MLVGASRLLHGGKRGFVHVIVQHRCGGRQHIGEGHPHLLAIGVDRHTYLLTFGQVHRIEQA
jgi:hypothetical protein